MWTYGGNGAGGATRLDVADPSSVWHELDAVVYPVVKATATAAKSTSVQPLNKPTTMTSGRPRRLAPRKTLRLFMLLGVALSTLTIWSMARMAHTLPAQPPAPAPSLLLLPPAALHALDAAAVPPALPARRLLLATHNLLAWWGKQPDAARIHTNSPPPGRGLPPRLLTLLGLMRSEARPPLHCTRLRVVCGEHGLTTPPVPPLKPA
jgi:hypothetical protein